MSWIEISATVFGLVYVVLLIRENIWCWVAGNVSVALMAISCYDAGLFADMSLQVLYFGIGCYGWIEWYQHRSGTRDELHVRQLSITAVTPLIIGFLVMAAVVYAILLRVRGAALTMADSTLFSASMVATYLQAKKFRENWLLWIPINLSYMVVYHVRALDAYVLLSLVFAALSTHGWFAWSKILSIQQGKQSGS